MKRLVTVIILLVLAAPLSAAENKREIIGEALGNPVYRDQIDEDGNLYSQFYDLFIMPFQKKYLEAHRNELEVKDWEIEYVLRYFEKKYNEDLKKKDPELMKQFAATRQQVKEVEKELANKNLRPGEREALENEKKFLETMLKPPAKDAVKNLLSSWKYYRLLYDNFGGGRIIREQEGPVPYDAMFKWLKQHETQGDFRITDPKLREAFYSYWKANVNSRYFLDKQRIQSEFLHPPWEPVKKNDK
jgi:hypothetical protein